MITPYMWPRMRLEALNRTEFLYENELRKLKLGPNPTDNLRRLQEIMDTEKDTDFIPLKHIGHTSEFANIKRVMHRMQDDLQDIQEQSGFLQTPSLISIITRGIHYYHRLRRLNMPKHEIKILQAIDELQVTIVDTALNMLNDLTEGAHTIEHDVTDAKDKDTVSTRQTRASTPLSDRLVIEPPAFETLPPIQEFDTSSEGLTPQSTSTGTIPKGSTITTATQAKLIQPSILNTANSVSINTRTQPTNSQSTVSSNLFTHYVPLEQGNNRQQNTRMFPFGQSMNNNANDGHAELIRMVTEQLSRQEAQITQLLNDFRRETTNRDIDRSLSQNEQEATGRDRSRLWNHDPEMSHRTQYGAARTTIYRELNAWKVLFSGDGLNQSYEEYSQAIYDFASAQSIPDNEIVRGISPTLKGPARVWYMKLNKDGMTLDRFFECLKEQFTPYMNEIDTIAELIKTKYETGLFDHIQLMYAKIALTQFSWTERKKVDIVTRTLPIEIRTAIVTRGIRTTSELTQLCRDLEAIFPKKNTEKTSANTYKAKRITEVECHEDPTIIDPIEEYDNSFQAEMINARRTFNLSNAAKAKVTARYPLEGCFNCLGKDHRHAQCSKPQTHTFCYRCGRPNATMKDCSTPRCVEKVLESSEIQKN